MKLYINTKTRQFLLNNAEFRNVISKRIRMYIDDNLSDYSWDIYEDSDERDKIRSILIEGFKQSEIEKHKPKGKGYFK